MKSYVPVFSKVGTLIISMYLLRFFVYIYNPEEVGLKSGMQLSALGLMCDTAPIIFLIALHVFLKVKTKALAIVYFAVLFLYYISNAEIMKQAMTLLSYDFLVSIDGTILAFLLLSPAKYTISIIFIVFVIYCVCKFGSSLYDDIANANRIFVILAVVVSISCVLYYENIKNEKLQQNFFRTEWIARPMYENFKIMTEDALEHRKNLQNGTAIGNIEDSNNELMPKSNFKNIILIAVESLDENYLHSTNRTIPSECTRNIDYMKKKYVNFVNYFTTALPTRYGLHSMLTSRIDYLKDGNNTPNLFTMLKQHGWETYFISAVSGHDGNEREFFKERYKPNHAFFSEYFEKKYKIKAQGWGIATDILFKEALHIVEKNKNEHTFILISTIDTHPPYGAVPDADDACMKNERITKSPFLLSLCAIDRKIHSFVNSALASEDPTLIIITADHSATHGENFTKRKDFDPDRIPLIFIANNDLDHFFSKTTNTNYCSQLDLAPTILKLCLLKQPDSFLGKNIIDADKSYSKITHGTVLIRSKNKTETIRQ